MSRELRVCRKCLPRQELDRDYFDNLARYIERMDEALKVDQDTYEARLSICGKCERLINGMCRLCGCFIELRAAQRVRRCPDIPAKWDAVRGIEEEDSV